MAACYVEAIRSIQPRGPYHIGGWSFGGLVAFDMAQQLQAAGERVGLLAMLDTAVRTNGERLDFDPAEFIADEVRGHVAVSVDELRSLELDEQLTFVMNRAKESNLLPAEFSLEDARRYVEVYRANWDAAQRYAPRIYSGRVTLFRASDKPEEYVRKNPTRGWDKVAAGGVDVFVVPGSHRTMVKNPNAEVLAEQLRLCLEQSTVCDNMGFAQTLPLKRKAQEAAR